MCVSDIIDHQHQDWNRRLIKEMFLQVDIPCITSIPLLSDSLIWPYSKESIYIVRSCYHWLMERQNMDSPKRQKLWKLTIPPKFKLFFWRLLHSAIPCNVNLQKGGSDSSALHQV